PRGTRARAALEAVPISILMSVIAPSLFLAGPAEFIAGCVAAIAATRLPLIATVAVGVGAVVLLRAGLGQALVMVHSHHRNETRTLQAALLTGGFMIAEAIGGVLSGSLALIADAAHMLTDTASLTLAWLAFRFARRPADASRTYGFGRLQILVAFANGISLFFIIGWIVFEAISRLMSPVEVLGDVMFGVAVAGLAVNVAAFWLLHGADRENLNIRGALL